MKLYLLKRKDNNFDYDQYHASVVAAMSPEIAEKIMLELCSDGEEWECTLIDASNMKEGVILASYSAG